MKKNILILIGLAALAMPLVAGCGTSSSASESVSSSVDAKTQAAIAAGNMLNFDAQAGKGLASRYFDAPGEIEYSADYEFTVNYTAVQQTVYAGASISISQDNDPDLESHPARITIVSPVKDPANTAKWIIFVLTAHLKLNGEELLKKDFNIRTDPVSVVKIADIGRLTSGDALITYGYYIGKYANSTDYYWVGSGTSGITAYAPIVASGYTPVAGDIVKITGSYSPYSGLLEFAKGCSLEKAKTDGTDKNFVAADISVPEEINWDGTADLADHQESLWINCEGTVVSNTASSSGNYTIALTVGSKSINVYAKAGADSTAILNGAKAVKANDKISVRGILGCYGTYQIIMPTITIK